MKTPNGHITLIALALIPIPIWILLAPDESNDHIFLQQWLSLVLLYPIVEELLFRGLIQPLIKKGVIGRWSGVSYANVVTSIFFAASHLFTREPIWAAAMFFPSLAFGYCKDRYKTVKISIALHCYYNASYFLATGA